MILDDRFLALSLEKRPELLLRLEEFANRYSLGDRPALVLQARPAPGPQLANNITANQDAVRRFLAGVKTEEGWWQGFRARVGETGTFRGVASLPTYGEPSWASEMHRDGHFIAGIWRFPAIDYRGNQQVPAVASFFAQMFSDFFTVIANSLEGAANQPLQYEATATLLGASKLHYAGDDEFAGRLRVRGRPPVMRHVQWSIETAAVGQAAWNSTAKLMGDALKYAFIPIDG